MVRLSVLFAVLVIGAYAYADEYLYGDVNHKDIKVFTYPPENIAKPGKVPLWKRRLTPEEAAIISDFRPPKEGELLFCSHSCESPCHCTDEHRKAVEKYYGPQ